jgi:uncharacterized membrane protein
MQKDDAQRRVDRIYAFREELTRLETDGLLTLDSDDAQKVEGYHNGLLAEYSESFDVDVTGADRQLSWGMRIVSFLGALAISAAIFFFFYRFWGDLSTSLQVTILVLAPLLLLLATGIVSTREKTLYFTSLLASVAFAAFVLNLSVLGTIFNITPSQNAFLAWSAFALLLAYGYNLRLPLVAGMTCLMGYLAATVGTWNGCYWISFGERPENFIVAGLLLSLVPLLPHPRHPQFAGQYRVFGFLAVFISILILSNYGAISYIGWSSDNIEYLYQTLGFLLSGSVIAIGIRRHWPGMVNLGATFFVLFLYTKLYDWWWEWMPKYLFFLLLGLIAIGLLFGMRRIRSTGREVAA